MSESSPGRTLRLLNSSIGLKFVMGVTGVILVGFVLVHLAGNLQMYIGPDTFNSYAATLQGNPPLVWTVRIVLLVATILSAQCTDVAVNRVLFEPGARTLSAMGMTALPRSFQSGAPLGAPMNISAASRKSSARVTIMCGPSRILSHCADGGSRWSGDR